ncbi:MAG: class I adenylate cyclase [Pseudomonadota bacterium]
MIKKFFRRGAAGPPTDNDAGKTAAKKVPFLELPPETAPAVKAEQPPLPQGRQGELIGRLRLFAQYNNQKVAFLYDLLPQRKKIVFDLIPLMLHLDVAPFPELRPAGSNIVHGVLGYTPSPNMRKSFEEAFPEQVLPPISGGRMLDPSLPIKSIALIGSMGSIAQNSKSDFDYWVCFDGASFTPGSYSLFKKKLALMEKWSLDFAGAEVHLFTVESARARLDDFGLAGKDSSGSAQAKLLKDEFYRTMTLVAGQTPLWWAAPPDIDDGQYAQWVETAKNSKLLDFAELVDLGNVHRVSLGELYGAAVWQINKTIGSPFKSVLKLALLEDYLHTRGANGLLCDELKRRIFSDEQNVQNIDPYVLMFERAAAHITGENRANDLELLRRSLYLKVGAGITGADYRKRRLPRKKRVMLQLVQRWGWSQARIEELNNYHNWSFTESREFSRAINGFVFRAYENVSRELNAQKENERLTITQRDLFVLKRKLFIFYSQRDNKVDSIRNVIEAPPPLDGLTIQPFRNTDGQGMWGVYRGLLSKEKAAEAGSQGLLLKSSPQLAGLLIWLVNNRLYGENTTINLNSGLGEDLAARATAPDIQNVLREQRAFFPFFRHMDLDEESLFEKPKIIRMFVTVNLEEPDKTSNINQLDICYQNNWGEIFFHGAVSTAEGLRSARNFLAEAGGDAPANFKAFLPSRHNTQVLRPRLNKFLGRDVF